VSIEVSQLVQLVIEPSNLENPLFSTFQSTLISSHSYENLKYIIMFFEQVVHNVTTQLRILDGLTNLNVECEDSRGQIKFV
jgi:glycosylphosphatidylinositol transamidase (GPIT) subunit GPI8